MISTIRGLDAIFHVFFVRSFEPVKNVFRRPKLISGFIVASTLLLAMVVLSEWLYEHFQ